jgi:hypothetical protein
MSLLPSLLEDLKARAGESQVVSRLASPRATARPARLGLDATEHAGKLKKSRDELHTAPLPSSPFIMHRFRSA